MKRCAVLLCLLLALSGCQQAPQPPQGDAGINNARQEAAKKLFAQAVLMLHNQNIKGAVENLQASIQADPTDPNAYLLLGQILIKAEQYDQAVVFLDQTAKTFPNNGSVFFLLSISNKMSGKILPAVLSARRSYEVFNAAGDTDLAKQAALLLEELIKEAQDQQAKADKQAATKEASGKQAVKEAGKEVVKDKK